MVEWILNILKGFYVLLDFIIFIKFDYFIKFKGCFNFYFLVEGFLCF